MKSEDEAEVRLLVCTSCNRQIESCAFCDEPDCTKAVCYSCVSIVLRQRIAQPHTHGG